MAPTPHPAYTNSSHIMCKYPFSGSLVLLLPLLHRFAPLVSFQTHSNLARTHTHMQRHIYTRTHTHEQASLAAMSGTPDCPILTNMSGMKVTAWLGERKKKKKKKKNTYRAVFAIKAGVVSFENVAFLKIVRPVILDVLREFLIRSVGGGEFTGVLVAA